MLQNKVDTNLALGKPEPLSLGHQNHYLPNLQKI